MTKRLSCHQQVIVVVAPALFLDGVDAACTAGYQRPKFWDVWNFALDETVLYWVKATGKDIPPKAM